MKIQTSMLDVDMLKADALEEEKAEYLDVDTKPYIMPHDIFDEDRIKRYAKHNWEF